jgi:hypothetical protein
MSTPSDNKCQPTFFPSRILIQGHNLLRKNKREILTDYYQAAIKKNQTTKKITLNLKLKNDMKIFLNSFPRT